MVNFNFTFTKKVLAYFARMHVRAFARVSGRRYNASFFWCVITLVANDVPALRGGVVAKRGGRWTWQRDGGGFDSRSGRECVATLDGLFTPIYSAIKQYNWVAAKGR